MISLMNEPVEDVELIFEMEHTIKAKVVSYHYSRFNRTTVIQFKASFVYYQQNEYEYFETVKSNFG